ncbi:hypothetical protein METHPM2_540011 [Pseudomonas sp. PM2]
MWHLNVPEIAATLSGRHDKGMTLSIFVGILCIFRKTIPGSCLNRHFRHILTALFRA